MTSGTRTRPAPSRAGLAALVALLVTCGVLLGTGSTTAGPVGGAARAAPELLDQVRPLGGQSVLDDRSPTVSRLDPGLLAALRRAAADAAADGVRLQVTSGWRSAEQQAQLLREAVAEHGSAAAAARWVATPETSLHVSGDAVDVGPSTAAAWLSRHGAAYGLCQTYANEPWHYELRPDAVTDGCPAMHADPTHDPRLQR